MIMTACPYCDEPVCVPFQMEFVGRFRREECDKCAGLMFIQMTQLDGKTYSQQAFKELGGNYD